MNELARMAAISKSSSYPAGATIVREKLLTETSKTPELLTAMIKRDKGFNPAGGDWEFLLVDGSIAKIQKRQKKGACLSCHSSAKDRDFVSGSYQ